MPKVTLDKDAFKALASETRLDILKTLDGTKMNLSELCSATNLNKATLHEHLKKLIETGIVKKIQRSGHKWVYYTLSWKGESLLHPENTKIVIMFSAAIMTLITAIIQIYLWAKGSFQQIAFDLTEQSPYLNATNDMAHNESLIKSIRDGGTITPSESIIFNQGLEGTTILYQDPIYLIVGCLCLIAFIVILTLVLRNLWKNRTPQL